MSLTWSDPESREKRKPEADLPLFDGKTFVAERDGERLSKQSIRVFNLMRDGKWRSLQEISAATGYPQASISARLRDFRKPQFGAHTVNREYVERGLFRYQLLEAGRYQLGGAR